MRKARRSLRIIERIKNISTLKNVNRYFVRQTICFTETNRFVVVEDYGSHFNNRVAFFPDG
jgi:hypothetical protein